MTTRIFFASLLLSLQGALSLQAAVERFHLEPALPSQLRPLGSVPTGQPDAASTPSGGHVSAPSPNGGAFQLVESSIGYLGPTTEAGLATKTSLTSAATTAINVGTSFDAAGAAGVPGNWRIVFPGVVNVSDGTIFSGTGNFDPSKVLEAVAMYRALSNAFPNDLAPRIGFLNALCEYIAPHTFAGHNAYARSTKERFLYGASDAGNLTASVNEDAMLVRAIDMFNVSLREFSDLFAATDTVSVGFPASWPPITTSDTAQVALIMSQRPQLIAAQRKFAQAISRAMVHFAETTNRLYALRYFQQFGDRSEFADIVTLIEQRTSDLNALLLLATAAQSPEMNRVFEKQELAPVINMVGTLNELRGSILRRDLRFVSHDNDGSAEVIRARSYHSKFIPFAVDVLIDPSRPTTTSVLLAKAQTYATKSITADTAAVGDTGRLEETIEGLRASQMQIGVQYQTQLAQLCGRKDDGTGRLIPDIEGAILPADRRPAGELGEIGQVWFQIDKAEHALAEAMEQRVKVSESIKIRQETWRKVEGSRQEMIQNAILASGEKLAEIERLGAEAQAKFSEYQARLAKKKRKRSLIGSIVSSVASAASSFFSGGTGAGISTLVGGLADTSTQYSIAGLGIKELRGQADLQRQLGEFNSKRVEIQTQQQAAIHFQSIREEGYRTEEAIQLLLLEAKAAEMSVLSAEIAVEQEYARLESLINQVSFLLQQQASVVELANSNPLNSPDYRLVRHLSVRNAEARFALAQEFAFLTTRAASYVALGTQRINELNNIGSKILKARSGARLDAMLDLLDAALGDVAFQRGARTLPNGIAISLRDQVIQKNRVFRDSLGRATAGVYPWEAQSVQISGVERNEATEQASNAAWIKFLADHFIDDGFSFPRLEIPFRLTLDQWGAAPNSHITSSINRLKNPLFTPDNFSQLIWYSSTQDTAFGVRVDIQGENLSNVGGPGRRVTVSLAAEGTSYVRNAPPPFTSPGQTPPAFDPTIQWYQFGLDQATPSIASIVASIAGQPAGLKNQQLHERSPANDRWVLRIYSNDANDYLLGQLQNVSDIRIEFAISAYSGTP